MTISAYTAEQELSALLQFRNVPFRWVRSGYDDASDCSFLRVSGQGYNETLRVTGAEMDLPLKDFTATVLAPFVDKLSKITKPVDVDQKL